MSKRKFSLGEIVRKLNQEKVDILVPPPSSAQSIDNGGSKSADTIENQLSDTSQQTAEQKTEPEYKSELPLQPSLGRPRNEPTISAQNHSKNHSTQESQRPIQSKEFSTANNIELAQQDNPPRHEMPSRFSSNQPISTAIPPSLSQTTGSGSNIDDIDEDEEPIDLFRYIGIIIRRRYIIAAIMLIAGFFSTYRYTTSSKYYIAHARLLFSPEKQDLTGNQFFQYFGDREKQFSTHLELLKSSSVLKMVADNLGNSVEAPTIAGGLSISQGETNGEKNNIIELSFNYSDPTIAQDVLNELSRTYIDYRRDVNSQEIDRLVFKFETQITKLQNELNIKESDLRRFKEDNKLVQLSNETNATVTKLTDMELALQKTNLDLIDTKERLTSLHSQISKQELDVVLSFTYQNPLQNRLSSLELELNTISAEYSEEHFKVKTIKQQIEILKAAAVDSISREANSKTFVKNPIRQSLLQEYINYSIEKSALESRRIAQEKIIELLNTDLLKLPSLEQNFAYLQRETESLLQTLRMLKNKYEETKIKKDSQESDLKLLEMAETPRFAIRKVKSSVIFIGILAGLLLGVAFAMVIEYFDQSLKDPTEVEKTLELPLLGIVPHIEADKDLFEQKDVAKNILEPFRALRANLKHIATTHQLKTFIICSAVKGEGKTTLSANLSITFAMDGKKVILIDADLRRSQMHTLFSIPKKTGLADYLLGTATIDDILKPTKYPNLFIITSGERPNNPAELLGTWRFDTLIEELRLRGDIILFDSPALLPVSDTITMAPKMDGCLVVVRTLWTPLKAAKQAKNQLKRVGCRIFGAILNGVTHSKGYYPYYYGYYGYYSYKYSYEDDTPKKLSIREIGLRIERGIKESLKSSWYGIPKHVASFGSFTRYSISKPLLWFLIALISILITVQIFYEAKYEPTYDNTIQYIGLGSNVSQNENSLPFNDIAGNPDVTSIPTQQDTNLVELFGLNDSLNIWLHNKQNNNVEGMLSFYHTSFKYPGGSITEWKEKLTKDILENRNKKNTLDIKNIRTVKHGQDYIEISVTIGAINSQRESSQSSVAMIWRKSEKGWKIIRERIAKE